MKNLFLFTLLLLCCTPAGHFKPRQILVITGGHDFEREPFFRMFDEFGDITWKEKTHPLPQGTFSAGEWNEIFAAALQNGHETATGS